MQFVNLFINDEEKSSPTFPELYTMKQSTPFLRCYDVPYEICHHKSPVAAIKEYIEYGYYVVCYLDQFYISGSDVYLKYHFGHLTFFYGYDDEKGIFLSEITLNQEDIKMLNAYLGGDMAFFQSPEHFFSIWHKTEPLWYEFKLDYLIRELKLYAHSYELNKNNNTRYNIVRFYDTQRRQDFDYDMGIYRYLRKIEQMERQTFHLVYEHKRLFRMRVAHLCKKGYYINDTVAILDEPSSALDSISKHELHNKMLDYARNKVSATNKRAYFIGDVGINDYFTFCPAAVRVLL